MSIDTQREMVGQLLRSQWRQQTGRQGPDQSPYPRQRPDFYFPGLTSRGWWDVADFPWIPQLESQCDLLRKEVLALVDQGFLTPPRVETIDPDQRDVDQQMVTAGGWQLYRLYYNGVMIEENCARCPETTRVFQSIPGFTGTIGFGVASGRTHVSAHCGVTNVKLRCHLGLEIPPECSLRVDDETRPWQQGKCLIFDDSFEHEVWNKSLDPRYVFIVDVHHPDMSGDEIAWVTEITQSLIQALPAEVRDRYMKPAVPSHAG